VRRYSARKDKSLFVIGVEGEPRAEGAHSIEGIQRTGWGQIPHAFPHLIIGFLTSRLEGYLRRFLYLQKKDWFVLQTHFKLDDKIHGVARVHDGVGLRSDCVIGVGREEGIEKLIVRRVVVIFTGIGRDGAETLCDLRRPSNHFLPKCDET
jgi:hypothetical protein